MWTVMVRGLFFSKLRIVCPDIFTFGVVLN
jgi:hypothetical protein